MDRSSSVLRLISSMTNAKTASRFSTDELSFVKLVTSEFEVTRRSDDVIEYVIDSNDHSSDPVTALSHVVFTGLHNHDITSRYTSNPITICKAILCKVSVKAFALAALDACLEQEHSPVEERKRCRDATTFKTVVKEKSQKRKANDGASTSADNSMNQHQGERHYPLIENSVSRLC